MLARMLLHMIPPACRINHAAHACPSPRGFVGFKIVDDSSVFCFRDLCYAKLFRAASSSRRNPPGVVYLTTAGRIERRSIQKHPVASIDLRRWHYFRDFTLEFEQEGIVVIETLGHTHLRIVVSADNGDSAGETDESRVSMDR